MACATKDRVTSELLGASIDSPKTRDCISALDREISCDLGDQVFAGNDEAQCDAIGMAYAALPEAKRLFLEGLPVLNGFRREAAAAELRSQGRR
jgi:hypothetical protein